MTLIKTSLLNAIAVGVRMLTLLGINKILAVYVGPTGYAALGQFQNAVQMLTTFASGAINTGVTKYTAEYKHNERMQITLWGTAGSISIIGSLITGIAIICANKTLAAIFLKDASYAGVFTWLGATLTLFTLNSTALAILNGKKEIPRYVLASILGSILSLIAIAFLSIHLGLYGALVALAIYQSLAFFSTIAIICNTKWFKFRYFFGNIKKEHLYNLAKYTAMALTSAICIPLSQIFVRNQIASTLGTEAAGHWEAMWRLSSAYLMLITTTLSVYYLPRLSEISDEKSIKIEIIEAYKVIIPLTIGSATLIYIFRDFIISLLFSKDFLPMRNLFAWQLLGDAFKITAWVLAYLMLSKAMMKTFITTEILFGIGFVLFTKLLTLHFGAQGAVQAHALNYLIYLFAMIYLMRKFLKNKAPEMSAPKNEAIITPTQ